MIIADAAQGHEADPGPETNQVSEKCFSKLRISKGVGHFGARINIKINISQYNIHLTFIF